MTWPWGAYLGEEALDERRAREDLVLEAHRPEHDPARAKATGQYLNSQLAKIEATRAGYEEAILLNEQGYVADGSGENMFVVKDEIISTPDLTASFLPGITRETVIGIAQSWDTRCSSASSCAPTSTSPTSSSCPARPPR